MKLIKPAVTLLLALFVTALLGTASVAATDPAAHEQEGTECVEYNDEVVYCIDYR